MLANMRGKLSISEEGCVVLSNGRTEYSTIWPQGSAVIQRRDNIGVLVPRARSRQSDFFPFGEWVTLLGGGISTYDKTCPDESWVIGKLAG